MPQISGITKDALGVPCSAVVDVRRRDNGALVARTVSDPVSGAFMVETVDNAPHVVTRHVAPVIEGDANWVHMAFGLHFDSGGVYDVKGNNPVVAGAPTIVADSSSVSGNSLHIPYGASVTINSTLLANIGTDLIGIGFSMRTTSTTSYCTVLVRDTGSFGAGAFAFMFNPGASNGVLEFWCSDYSLSSPMLTASGFSVADATRHYIELNRTGDLWELSVGGIVRASRTWGGSISPSSTPVTIGRSVGYSRDFEGNVDEVRMFVGSQIHTGSFTAPSEPFLDAPKPGTPTANAQVFDNVIPGTPTIPEA